VSDTYDVAGKSNMDDLKSRLEKICRSNTKQYFVKAVIALILTEELRSCEGKTKVSSRSGYRAFGFSRRGF
jgi:hypothetical protein